jgi:hypothetical protein
MWQQFCPTDRSQRHAAPPITASEPVFGVRNSGLRAVECPRSRRTPIRRGTLGNRGSDGGTARWSVYFRNITNRNGSASHGVFVAANRSGLRPCRRGSYNCLLVFDAGNLSPSTERRALASGPSRRVGGNLDNGAGGPIIRSCRHQDRY